MPAYMKIGDIKGEATDQDHKEWVLLESMSSPIYRSIPEGAKDMQRSRGDTTLGDVVVVRQLDKSSVKLQESCAGGAFFKEVEVHFCTTVKKKQETYLSYKLKNVIITGYSFHGNASSSPAPSEQLTFGFTEIEWTYTVIDPETGDKKGQVPGKYAPGTGKAG